MKKTTIFLFAMAVTIVVSTSAFGQTASKRIQFAKGKTSSVAS